MNATGVEAISFTVKIHEWPQGTGLRPCKLTKELRETLDNKIVQLFCEIMPPEVITVDGIIEIRLGVLVTPEHKETDQ